MNTEIYKISKYVRQKIIIYIILSIYGFGISHAQNYHLNYEHITIKQGLSNNWVNDIIQDKFGFIWIATQDGLNRYDGYKFQVFTTNHNLPSNKVHCLAKDKEDNIWIATGAGLAKWNITTEEIERVSFFEGKVIHYIYIDEEGQLWLSSNNVIYCLDKNNKVVQKKLNNFNKTTVQKIWKQKIHGQEEMFSDGIVNIKNLVVCQIHYFNKKTQQWELLLESKQRFASISSSGQCFFISMYQNEDKKVNIKNYAPHIIRDIKFIEFPWQEGIDKYTELDLFLEEADIKWIIYHGRMIAINWQKKEAIYYDQYFKKKSFFLEERFIDKSGTIWLTSIASGVFILPRHQNYNFKYYAPKTSKLSGYSVRAIYQDIEKNIWISTYNENKVLDIFFNDGRHETMPIGGIAFKIIAGVDKNILWIGSDNKLLKVNKKTKQVIKKYENLGDYPRDLLITQNKKMYLVNHEFFGILDLKTEELKKYTHIKGSTCLLEAKNGQVWIGSKDKGLGLLNIKSMKVKYFSYDKSNPQSISSNHVKHIYQDKKGRFWVATELGLNLFDEKNKTFTHFTKAHGLLDEMVYVILEDTQGNLWLSTNQGISKFNPETKKFVNYDERYGLQDNEFNTNSYFKNEDTGEMFFGGVNGVNSFYPENMKRNTASSPLVLTAFRRKGRIVKLGKPLSEVKKISMNYDEAQSLTFEFVALSFFQSKQNQYAYKIEEIHDTWISLGTKNELTLTNLNAGTYTLHIKGSNNHGVWNEEGLTIILVVKPPFWQTWWFISLLIISFLLSVYAIYRWRVYQVRKHEKYLANEVSIRTEKIQSQAEALEEQAEELDALNKTKDRLFAIIAHDLRSPMTTFESITQQLDFYIEQNEIERIKGLNQYIKQSSNNLNNLLDNLLSWALIQRNVISYSPQYLYLKKIVKDVLENYTILINNYQIQTKIDIEDSLEIYADENALRTILRNLINNAIKFTPQNGIIKIKSYQQERYTIIEIKDTGKGISKDRIKNIFKNTFKSMGLRGEKGTGLGLVLVAEFMEMHKGQIGVLSQENEGTHITLKFPKKP